MLKQLKIEIEALWREAKPRLRRLWVWALLGLRAAWALARPVLILALQIVAALIVLFEEWGWRPLVELLGRLARFRLWAMLELWIAGLPPYGAFAVFALPTTILLPLKFVAIWLLANSYIWTAGALFLGAKVVSTALIARIFMLTKPALMQITWFARAYNWFMPWKEAIFAQIRASWAWRYGRMVKTRVKHEAKQAWVRWKPTVERAVSDWQPRLQAAWIGTRLRVRETWARLKPQIKTQITSTREVLRHAWARVSGS